MARDRGKAVVFTRPYRAEVHEGVRFPANDAEGVVIQTQYSVISRGTELDLYTNQMHGRGANAQWYPILPGYLPVGPVVEVGSAVTHLKEGDLAIGSNLFGDFDERYCCAWGGHCEYTVVSRASHPSCAAQRAVRVPDGIEPRFAPLAVLGAVAYKGIDMKVRPQAGETVVVVGAGVIGNFAAQLCRLAGADVVIADLVPQRLAVARQCGLTQTINAAEQSLEDSIRQLDGGRGPDVIIDVTGEPNVLERLLHLPRVGGRVHGQGMYLEPVGIYFPETLFGRDLTLSATCGEMPEHASAVLDLMAGGKLTHEPLLSDVMPVARATEAYQKVHDQPDQVMTVALAW